MLSLFKVLEYFLGGAQNGEGPIPSRDTLFCLARKLALFIIEKNSMFSEGQGDAGGGVAGRGWGWGRGRSRV